MSAFLQSGRFYPGETPIFRVRFRPEGDAPCQGLTAQRQEFPERQSNIRSAPLRRSAAILGLEAKEHHEWPISHKCSGRYAAAKSFG